MQTYKQTQPEVEGLRPVIHLYTVTTELSAYCKPKGLLQEESCGFRPYRVATDMMFGVRRSARVPLFLCFLDLKKIHDSVDRTLCQVLDRFGLPSQMIKVICKFQDGWKLACEVMTAHTRSGLVAQGLL